MRLPSRARNKVAPTLTWSISSTSPKKVPEAAFREWNEAIRSVKRG